MKKFLLLLLASSFIIACEEKDLTGDNPPLPIENVEIAVSFLYNGKGYKTDSILTNNKGNKFFLTDVKFLLSGVFVKSMEDTFRRDDGYFTYSWTNLEELVMELPDGGYSGHYGFELGVDSITNVDLEPSQAPAGSGLTDTDMYRNDGTGYNSIVIIGRALDPANPDDTIGTIPFRYEIGSLLLDRSLRSGQANFAVTADTQVNLILNVDTWPIFNDFDIVTRPMVTTDPSNSVDFAVAKEFSDSLLIQLF